jgi:hypothetical protein
MGWDACGCGPTCIRCRPNLAGRSKCGFIQSYVEVRDEDRCIARHERCYRRQQQVLDLEHYLDVLERKPGALAGAKTRRLASARIVASELRSAASRTDSPAWQTERHTADDSAHKSGQRAWTRAGCEPPVEAVITLGCADAAAIRHLAEAADLAHTRSELMELSELSRFERPLPVMTDNDGLLGQEVAP